MRAKIISLSLWVAKYSRSVTREKAPLDPLIEINRTIMQGLQAGCRLNVSRGLAKTGAGNAPGFSLSVPAVALRRSPLRPLNLLAHPCAAAKIA